MDNYFDDDDKITDFILNKNTDGDGSEITNVDRLYELIDDVDNGYYNNNEWYVDKNDLCFKYVRYLHDDGG